MQKTSRSLWQYHRDAPSDQIVHSKSFESKIKMTGNTPVNENKKCSNCSNIRIIK